MGIDIYSVKKWFRMLCGKSILHVNQEMGKYFSPAEIKGYYNDLTEKVTKDAAHIRQIAYIPQFETTSGEKVYFAVTVFQYALGCYDLYLETQDPCYIAKFKTCVDWTVDHQNENGSFDAFSFLYPDAPYGAMCQGEAASVLLRAYVCFGDEKYLHMARKAVDFMLLPVEEGGTAKYNGDEIILLEYTHLPAVLNGWVFAYFGIYDLYLATQEKKYGDICRRTLFSLKNRLSAFDNGYWSLYELAGKIASPFYHNLHIAQLRALYTVDADPVWQEYENRWCAFAGSFWKRKRAFLKKAIQKILE